MLVKRAQMFPVECVARGYLAGSGWKEYQASGTVCGIALPARAAGWVETAGADFYAIDKEPGWHARRKHFVRGRRKAVGADAAHELRRLTLAIYSKGRRSCGVARIDSGGYEI